MKRKHLQLVWNNPSHNKPINIFDVFIEMNKTYNLMMRFYFDVVMSSFEQFKTNDPIRKKENILRLIPHGKFVRINGIVFNKELKETYIIMDEHGQEIACVPINFSIATITP